MKQLRNVPQHTDVETERIEIENKQTVQKVAPPLEEQQEGLIECRLNRAHPAFNYNQQKII